MLVGHASVRKGRDSGVGGGVSTLPAIAPMHSRSVGELFHYAEWVTKRLGPRRRLAPVVVGNVTVSLTRRRERGAARYARK